MCKKNERREPNAGNSDAFMANRKKKMVTAARLEGFWQDYGGRVLVMVIQYSRK